ncbi:MAG: hypothetical protein K2X38_17975 [Gemmataceae bacterium]|nr:hypothetical protein [Gemmataceae bacterium]
MSDVDKPAPYRVVYSSLVRQRILDLAAEARTRSDGEAFLAALREFDRRLHIYPHFGDPLTDLLVEAGQVASRGGAAACDALRGFGGA